jgi:CIC family chloride channel protein
MRQLEAYGRDGLPVLSEDARSVLGWITPHSVLRTVAKELTTPLGVQSVTDTPTALRGFRVLEIGVDEASHYAGKKLGSIQWPWAHTPVSVLHGNRLREADPGITINAGDRINVLVPGPERSGA